MHLQDVAESAARPIHTLSTLNIKSRTLYIVIIIPGSVMSICRIWSHYVRPTDTEKGGWGREKQLMPSLISSFLPGWLPYYITSTLPPPPSKAFGISVIQKMHSHDAFQSSCPNTPLLQTTLAVSHYTGPLLLVGRFSAAVLYVSSPGLSRAGVSSPRAGVIPPPLSPPPSTPSTT